MSEDEPDAAAVDEQPVPQNDLTLADVSAQWLAIATDDQKSPRPDLERLITFVSKRGFTPPVEGNPRSQAIVHYEKHVIRFGEWPAETSPEEYVAAGRDAVLNADRIFIHRFRGVWQVGFWRQVEGERPILVQYRLEPGRWTTVFRPAVSLEALLAGPEFEEIRWIRR